MNKTPSIPPKPPGEIAVESRASDTPELTMIIDFRQDREVYAPNQALENILKQVETDNRQEDDIEFVIPKNDFKNCKALNYYSRLLAIKSGINKNGNTQGNQDATQAMSTIVFITEASKHPEYCTTYMLRKFSNVICEALETLLPLKEFAEGIDFDSYGFLDMTDDKGNASRVSDFSLTLYGSKNPITPEMLKEIHDKTWKPESDTYRCQSDNIIHLLIQVCYAILMHYFRKGVVIRICENCGQIFIPSRTNDKYCTRIAPQEKDSKKPKSCGKYMKYQNQRIHNDNDEFKTEHDRLSKRVKFEETPIFQKEYNETKGNPEARRKVIEKWAEKYPRRKMKGAKQNEEK